MARQGNTPTATTRYRETTADTRKKDHQEVDDSAKVSGPGRVKAARDKVHGQKDTNNPFSARQGNAPHTAEYDGPGQVESSGSRVGNTPHTSAKR